MTSLFVRHVLKLGGRGKDKWQWRKIVIDSNAKLKYYEQKSSNTADLRGELDLEGNTSGTVDTASKQFKKLNDIKRPKPSSSLGIQDYTSGSISFVQLQPKNASKSYIFAVPSSELDAWIQILTDARQGGAKLVELMKSREASRSSQQPLQSPIQSSTPTTTSVDTVSAVSQPMAVSSTSVASERATKLDPSVDSCFIFDTYIPPDSSDQGRQALEDLNHYFITNFMQPNQPQPQLQPPQQQQYQPSQQPFEQQSLLQQQQALQQPQQQIQSSPALNTYQQAHQSWPPQQQPIVQSPTVAQNYRGSISVQEQTVQYQTLPLHSQDQQQVQNFSYAQAQPMYNSNLQYSQTEGQQIGTSAPAVANVETSVAPQVDTMQTSTPQVDPGLEELKNIENLMAGITSELSDELNPWKGLL